MGEVALIKFKDKDEWRESRGIVGGSDVASILGISKWKSNHQLWLEKTGRVEPEDISEKDVVIFGQQAEPHLIALFALNNPQYSVQDMSNTMYTNSGYPHATASIDGGLFDKESGKRGTLEIKTTTIRRKQDWDQWNGQIPQYYYTQLLHYLMITEFDFAILYAMIRTEDNYKNTVAYIRQYEVKKEDVLEDIEYIKAKEREFINAVLEDRESALILPEI